MVGITTCRSCGSSLFEDAGRCYDCGCVVAKPRFILEVCHVGGRIEREVSPDEEITLGRASDNDMVLTDPRISRHHLRLVFGEDSAWLEELGATNPCSISGRPIGAGVRFAPGERLELRGATITLARQGRPLVGKGVGAQNP